MFRSEEDAAHRFRRSCARGCPVNEKRARRPFGRRARLTIPSGSSQCRFVRCFAHPSGSSQCRFSAGDLRAAPARTSFPRPLLARPAALRTRRVHPNAAFRPATFARRRRGRPSRARCSPGPLLCAPVGFIPMPLFGRRPSRGAGADVLPAPVARPARCFALRRPGLRMRAGGNAKGRKPPELPSFYGSPCWTRTNDTAVNSRMLYRLS